MDLRWDNWLSKVGENIVHFIKGCKDVHWAHAELERKLKDLLNGTNFCEELEKLREPAERKIFFDKYDFSFSKFQDLMKQVEASAGDSQLLVELYYLSKAFYPKFSELLEKISRQKQNPKSGQSTDRPLAD
jgi:hypothetical protein